VKNISSRRTEMIEVQKQSDPMMERKGQRRASW